VARRKKAPIDMRPIEVRRKEWIDKYPDKFLICRQGHDFPKPFPGRRMTNTSIVPWFYDDGRREGEVLITQKCKHCGRVRWRISGPRGMYYSEATKWNYDDPKGYATPPGLGIPRSAYGDEYWRRIIDADPDLTQEVEAREEEEQ